MNVDRKDLIALVADKNMKSAIVGMLNRTRSLGIRSIRSDVFDHPLHDPGCRIEGHDFLKPFKNLYERAILMFDWEGSGATDSAEALESQGDDEFMRSGWCDRAKTIVIDPELDVWVWSDSPHVDEALGWLGRSPNVRQWLREKGYWITGQPKPQRSKEALEDALRMVRQPRSSSLYATLAEHVSLDRCSDRAFVRFRDTLREWFSDAHSAE